MCRHYGVPFLSFRIISDTHAGGRARADAYADFWAHVSEASFGFLRLLVDKLGQTSAAILGRPAQPQAYPSSIPPPPVLEA